MPDIRGQSHNGSGTSYGLTRRENRCDVEEEISHGFKKMRSDMQRVELRKTRRKIIWKIISQNDGQQIALVSGNHTNGKFQGLITRTTLNGGGIMRLLAGKFVRIVDT